MKHMLFWGLIAVFPVCLHAQTQNEAVTAAVRDYVDGFYYGDTAKIHQSISPSVQKYGYYIPNGKAVYEGEPMSFREMVDYAAKVKKRGVSPNVEKFPKKIEVFDVLDQTASAKLTAWWGSDYLLLARIDGHWMITHVLWQSPQPKTK